LDTAESHRHFERVPRVWVALGCIGFGCACGRLGVSSPDAGGEVALEDADRSPLGIADASDETVLLGDDAMSAAPDGGQSCTTDSIVLAVDQPASGGGDSRVVALEAFYPPTGAVTILGHLDCTADVLPVDGLAVDRAGGLYASTENGVYRIEPTDAGFVCRLPNLVVPPNRNFLQPIGIAFVGESDAEESLIASLFWVHSGEYSITNVPVSSSPLGVISIDAGTALIGDGAAPLGSLTGTGDGRLFVLGPGLVQVDPATGSVVQSIPLPVFVSGPPTPFAFWAGDFYVFPSFFSFADGGFGSSAILRVRPSDGTVQVVAQTDGSVVGAGVSICAPLQ
jgi:hypothetical protein